MESKREEALVAKQHAEKRFAEKDFVGAKNFALKAQMLYPELEGISQMVATFDVYVASEGKVNGEVDFYSILGLKPSADKSSVKRQYKRLAVLLHPDKNRTVGADGAFRLVSEAWTHLSDISKRATYDRKRNGQLSSTVVAGATYPTNCAKSSLPPTFWTVCTSCQVQYEYLRKYVNKRLSCKNCRATFMAVEMGTAPINGSYPVSQFSYGPENGYNSSHGHNMSFYPTSPVYVSGNGVPVYHSGHGSEYVSNVSFQWSTSPGSSGGYVSPNGFTTSADTLYQSNGYPSKPGKKVKADVSANGSVGCNQSSGTTNVRRPYKKRKVENGGNSAVNGDELGGKVVTEAAMPKENGCTVPKFSATNESSVKRSIPPLIDIRTLLIEKARKEIRKRLEEMKSESIENGEKTHIPGKPGESRRRAHLGISHLEPKKLGPVTLTVPDSDFHDFDKDRTEECFQPKQIWALYDEEDGMPRLYCLIRQIISVNPFKILISYLGSKTDTEFGAVNWIDSGFTKSCGHFRATTTDIIEGVNMFSHVLSREKAGRGGCVRLYPRSGDIWAVYRNWSKDWNRSTPYDVRHQYEMVEIMDDYNEEIGICVTPLVKVEGYKTVYQRSTDKAAVQLIPRREMVRFSHQVPSWLLKEVTNLPDECWDLDPAAIPDQLLQPVKDTEIQDLNKPSEKDS
ncbi:J protein JJJ2-like [Chenopodium quinoa]|uniref:J domain-containing protein n=1 Tax=Chenopodium quinoa TaxID=63459 RepID=A0A803MGJ1_CHEQI|nr:J protein JJJ2-like [Chenopodium quinoa]XP_021766325.1 J protein JJJ2-like [Chenopodium quinoa]